MKDITKVFGKLFQYAGAFRITILLSAVFAACAAVINLKAYICVYEVAKLLIESGGAFQSLDLLKLSGLGKQAVFYVGMGFGVYGMHSSSNLMLAKASLTAVDDILAEEPLPEAESKKTPENYEIKMDHVSFQYEEGVKALDDVSLTIRPGTVTALVGESGGGKSTIANLIARFWDVTEGAVTVGGVDVRNISYWEWMKKVSIVFQDTSLFKMSIAQNVAMYRPDATREEIAFALKQAQCDDILEKMPDGMDTVIGTKGIYLSGGEMQRIALARAILKDAPVVLLDEATAFADAENEFLIQKALDSLLKGKTVLMIAHRLQTIINADQILVIQKGKIKEQGTHEELLAKEGVYARMYQEYESSVSWKIGGGKHA